MEPRTRSHNGLKVIAVMGVLIAAAGIVTMTSLRRDHASIRIIFSSEWKFHHIIGDGPDYVDDCWGVAGVDACRETRR
jgi:hypothetical protein